MARQIRSNWRWHAAALALYTGLAILLIAHGASPVHNLYGQGSDAEQFTWFFAWWPYAFAHHLDPLYTAIIWQPRGLNLAWMTSTPMLALASLPFTLAAGPVLAVNVVSLAAPVLAAWAAYFLCLYIARQPLAAMVGGYLFGFSSYEMAHAGAQLNLDFTACIPCLLLLALARLDDNISRGFAISGTVALLVFSFGCSVELVATQLFIGSLAWLLAYVQFPPRRAALRRLALEGVMAGPIVALLLSPMLWGMFTRPRTMKLPPHWPLVYVTDPLNLFLPTLNSALGGRLALPVTQHFSGLLNEQVAYLGLPLLLICYAYGKNSSRYLGLVLAGLILLSCGPYLRLDGLATPVPLPWALFRHLPLIGLALPARFMLFASLTAAIMAACWIAQAASGGARRRRLICGLLAGAAILPALSPQPLPYSKFFAPGRLEAVLGPHPRILILPFGIMGPSSYWQAENDFGFSQTGGYLGFPPDFIQADKPVMWFYFGLDAPGFAPDFARFCAAAHTQYIVAGPGTTAHDLAKIAAFGWPARVVDDVTIFSLPQTP